MIKIDKWMLERVFEPAAREIESWTGIGQYRVARFCVLVSVAADAARTLSVSTPREYAFLGMSLFAGACMVVVTFAAQVMVTRAGANWIKHDRVMGVLRTLQFATCAVASLLAIMLWPPGLRDVASIALAAAWGFMSGDRLPPPKERHAFEPVASSA